MLQVNISVTDLDRLKEIQDNHPHHVARRRALAMLLKSKELPHHQIADIAGVCENTLREYFVSYQEGGIDSLMAMNFRQPESKLKPFDDVIKDHFNKNPISTITQACKVVKDLTGVVLKNTQMRTYLKKTLGSNTAK